MKIDPALNPAALRPRLERFFALTGPKILALDRAWDPAKGSPVITTRGKYGARGWTEWTQGFQFGCQLLQYDATDDERFLKLGRDNVTRHMAPHVSHTGVHDHGFNNISTYGNLRRLARAGRFQTSSDAVQFYEFALKISGAVQAARWTTLRDGTGFIHSFNGPHSLFSDTIRSCRSLMLAHRLGHHLMGENDRRHSLLGRAVEHMANLARFNVWFGAGRDAFDTPGRVAHEGIFNTADGNYRCPGTQQGYSPFSTWTRGLAWVLLGAAEELEYLPEFSDAELKPYGGRANIEAMLVAMATATADFYIKHSTADGIVYWDTGAPGLAHIKNPYDKKSKPDNDYEPVDSSASVIAAQGLLRLGCALGMRTKRAKNYFQAGLSIARTIYSDPYLSADPAHQGLILHSVYHRPNGWDHIPHGAKVPLGESSMWGDYHAMELAVYLQRLADGGPYLTFY